MANKVIKTRMVQKHDTSENWAKAENFSPLVGEIIVYDDLNKFKIGDGKTNVNDLPFTGVGNSGIGSSSTVLNSDENKALTAFSAASGYKTIAGKKAFKITAKPSDTSFTLDSVDGLVVGDVVSYSIPQSGSGTSSVAWKEMQDIAKITAISAKTITLDAAIPNNLAAADIANYQSSTNRIACRLWVNEKPEIGTYDLSTKANARGRECKALGEASDVGGKGNVVTAPYGAATNSGNKVDAENGFAFGGGNTLEQSANRSAIGGINNTGRAYASFLGGNQSESEETARESFGWGMGLKVTNPNEAVVGKFNEPKTGLLFSAGNGTNEGNRHNAFEIYDDGSVSAQGDIKRVAYATTENQTGWVKFAEYSFATYKQGGALFNIKQTYVGKKYNVLIELELNTVDSGYHPDEGIIFRQLAGKDICDDVGYVIDSATNNISFYIKKHRYDYIYINLLSDTFGDYMKYYSNNPIEANTPTFTGKMSNSLLGASKEYVDTKFGSIDLSDYYTKSEVDSKIAASGGTSDPNTVIISSAADFSTTQTFTKKTIKIAAGIDLPANSTITFNNCIIHGLSKNTSITTYGDNLTFTNCNIYDLTILGIGDSSTSSLNVKLTLTNCKLNNCSVYGSALRSSFLSDCTFINSSYSTPATGDIYFSGNTTFIGGSITQTDGNGSLMLVKNSRTFINGTNINMEITGTTLFKNEMTGHTSSLSLIGCYEKNNKTINIATDITTTPVLATLKTLNFTPITQTQE